MLDGLFLALVIQAVKVYIASIIILVVWIQWKKCNLNSSSRFLDIGAGVGKPNFHAAFAIDVRLSIGLEIMDIRYQVLLSLCAVIIL